MVGDERRVRHLGDDELEVEALRVAEAKTAPRRAASPGTGSARSRAPPRSRRARQSGGPSPRRGGHAAPRVLEERDVRAGRALLVRVEEVVHGRVVLVDRLLHEPQPERARVELDVRGASAVMQVMWWIPSRRTHSILVAAERRQLEPERRALALFAREVDAAAVRLDDLARDREAEADAGDSARLCLAAEELREDARLVLLRDPEALVANRDADDPGLALAESTNMRPPSGEYLTAFAIRLVVTWTRRSRSPRTRSPSSGTVTTISCPGRVCACELDFVVEQPGKVEGLQIELEPAATLVGREELVDEPVQPAPLVVDDLDVPAQRCRVGVAPEDEARVAEDARERRAQLVRDDRDQLRLRPLALAQLLVLALEIPAPCSTEEAIELNAPVSSRISAGPSCGMRIEKSPEAIRAAPVATSRTGCATDRTR